jgi:phosphotransferase system HPr (HPr) family protein
MTTAVVERDVEVAASLGLHARPAAEFARIAAGYNADIHVAKGDRDIDAKSVLLLLTLDVRRGDHVRIRANGPDAARAVDALVGLVTRP